MSGQGKIKVQGNHHVMKNTYRGAQMGPKNIWGGPSAPPISNQFI